MQVSVWDSLCRFVALGAWSTWTSFPRSSTTRSTKASTWAIGTGETATPEMANNAIANIREVIKGLYNDGISEEIRIQYGGSVKPSNVEELMNQNDIDGALVGGASLKADSFSQVVNF